VTYIQIHIQIHCLCIFGLYGAIQMLLLLLLLLLLFNCLFLPWLVVLTSVEMCPVVDAVSSACVCPPAAISISSDTVCLVDWSAEVQPRDLHSNTLRSRQVVFPCLLRTFIHSRQEQYDSQAAFCIICNSSPYCYHCLTSSSG